MKNNGFVREYLERVSWRVLEEHRTVIKSMIRGHAGVYALYRGDKLYYVGLANNLMSRVNQHLKDRHHGLWDRFSVYLITDAKHLRGLESLMLRVMDTTGNRVKGRLAGAQDLVKLLKRRIEEKAKDDIAVLLGGRFVSRRRSSKARASGASGLAGLFEKPVRLRAMCRGKLVRATLRRDGQIRFQRKLYPSPTAAAIAALGSRANGWNFWRYRQAKGTWVKLEEIRR